MDAGGRPGKCKINCLNKLEFILLSVHSCHRFEPHDFTRVPPSSDIQAFVQLERESNGHLYLSLVEDMLSQPHSNKEQLQGFEAAAQNLGNLRNQKKTRLSQHLLNIMSYNDSDIRQHNEQVPTDASQTRTTLPDSHTRQHLGPMQHYTTVFAPLSVNTSEIDSNVSIRS